MKNPNKPTHQTSKVENRDQRTNTRSQNFGCATCFRSRCVGELEGGILPYAEWTGIRKKIFDFGHRLESTFEALWTVLGRQIVFHYSGHQKEFAKQMLLNTVDMAET